MRVVLSEEGLRAAADLGVTRQQIKAALASGQRLVEEIDEHTRAVTGRLDDALITVWCVELDDDEWEVATAFSAGTAVQIKWNHFFGGSSPDAEG